MELRVLKYFLMVAREENITRAAELLHITQPTLSRQLMQLEEQLGTKLFVRGKHNIYLTDDGMLLKKRAQDIVELADKTEKEFTDRNEELAGEIVFGCGETRSINELASIMSSFKSVNSMIQYEMYTANADEIKERIDRGLIDIGLLTEPVDISKYNFIRLENKEKWGVLVRKDSHLAGKEYVTADNLIDIPLLMVKRDIVRNEIENWFGNNYNKLNIAGKYNLLNNAAVMVEHNIGAALCFQLNNGYDNLEFIPLYPPLETGCVIVWQKNRTLSYAAEKFLEYAKIYVKSISKYEE